MRDWRKPWMRELRTLRFSRLWTMTQETFRLHASADSRDAACVQKNAVASYAEALGIDMREARNLIAKHRKHMGK